MESAWCAPTAERAGKKVLFEFPETQAQANARCDRAAGLRGAEPSNSKELRAVWSIRGASDRPLPKTNLAAFTVGLQGGLLPIDCGCRAISKDEARRIAPVVNKRMADGRGTRVIQSERRPSYACRSGRQRSPLHCLRDPKQGHEGASIPAETDTTATRCPVEKPYCRHSTFPVRTGRSRLTRIVSSAWRSVRETVNINGLRCRSTLLSHPDTQQPMINRFVIDGRKTGSIITARSVRQPQNDS